MAIKITGGTYNAGVTAANQLQVVTPTTEAQAGFAAMSSEVDAGSVLPAGRTMRAAYINDDYQLSTTLDVLLFSEAFVGSALNVFQWFQSTSTYTIAVLSGFAQTNSGGSVATGSCVISSYNQFPLIPGNTTFFNFAARTTAGEATSKTIEMGVGFVTAGTPSTDGAFFQWNGSSFSAVVINNSVSATQAVTMPTNSVTHNFTIAVSSDNVEFWIDDILVASIPSNAPDDSSIRPGSAPVFIRQYGTATVSAVSRIEVSEISVQVHGNTMFRDQAGASSYAGGNINTGQTGFATLTSQGNYVNSTDPAPVTLSNTTAGFSTLGGNFAFNAPAGAAQDNILFAFQVPAGSVTTAARTLHMTGINIETFNTVLAGAAGLHAFVWYVAFGATSVTLATVADAAGVIATRRLAIGGQSFPTLAPIGFKAEAIRHTFDTPIVVRPGQYLHVIVKCLVGTATPTQVFRGTVGINGYYL
jgi:hypothetical protein